MKDFVETCKPDDFIQVFLEVINSLSMANEDFDYSHYDLHYQNVLIRRLISPIIIPYRKARGTSNDDTGTNFMAIEFLATIIDFGYNHMKIGSYNFGRYGYSGVFKADESYPMFDAYKFLCFCGEACISGKSQNLAVWDVISVIYDFFQEKKTIKGVLSNIPKTLADRIDERINNPTKDFYSINDNHKNTTFRQFIDYIIANFNPPFLSDDLTSFNSSYPIYDGQLRTNFDDFIYSLTDHSKVPSNIHDLAYTFTAVNNLPSSGTQYDKNELFNWITSNTDIEGLYNKEFYEYSNNLVSLEKATRDLASKGYFQERPVINYLNDFNSYKDSIYNLFRLKEAIFLMQDWIISATFALSISNLIGRHDADLRNMDNRLNLVINSYNSMRDSVYNTNLYLKGLSDKDFAGVNPDIKYFYKTKLNQLVKLL